MFERFIFDINTARANIEEQYQKQRKQQANSNGKNTLQDHSISRTASSATSAKSHPNFARSSIDFQQSIFSIDIRSKKVDISPLQNRKIQNMAAVSAEVAVPQTGWQTWQKSDCCPTAEVAEDSILQGAIDKQTDKLAKFLELASCAVTLAELKKLLLRFAVHDWTLLERSRMSNKYTPIALRLIHSEDQNKFVVLEELAELCWQIHSYDSVNSIRSSLL